MSSPAPAPPAPATTLRRWQAEVLDRLEGWGGEPFLISAAPGAGKTRPALELARRLLAAGEVDRVVVVCPTSPLTRQWAAAAAALGVQLMPDAPALRPSRDFHGAAVTYARVATMARAYGRECSPRTLVIADEVHHLGDDLSWGEGFARAFAATRRWLLLSGTPFRSDDAAIPGVRYDTDGLAEADFSYGYADAIRDGVCRPVTFVAYDGVLRWRSGERELESSFEEAIGAREAARRYRTAISTELAEGLPRILRDAHARLTELRAGAHRDAGGLVVAADGAHARRVARLLREEIAGVEPTVVLHTEADAAARLRAFTHSSEPWIVAVNMVSEGVDIPRLRVGVYATAAKTPLAFRQIVGRFVRTLPGRRPEPSWLHLPSDPVLRALAAEVEEEIAPARREREDLEGEDPFEERAETERGARMEDFVPLAAEVSPQLDLFGGGGQVAAEPAAPAAGAGAGAGDEEEVPLFERAERLREQRHRLVAEARRRFGRSYAEINADVNRRVGIASVERATLEQLERSIAVLREDLWR